MWEGLSVCRKEKAPKDLRERAREELCHRPQREGASIEEGGLWRGPGSPGPDRLLDWASAVAQEGHRSEVGTAGRGDRVEELDSKRKMDTRA